MDQAENLRNILKSQSKSNSTARVITVTSGKGGVGKSSISVNLALQLSRLGKRCIILDADFGFANIEILLGIRPEKNMADLIFRDDTITNVITKGPCNIGFISGGSGIQELINLDKNQIQRLIRKLGELDEVADIVIIDTGAGISESILDFIAVSNEVLLVVTPEPTSITDAYALLKTLDRKQNCPENNTIIRVVTNHVDTYEQGKELYNKLSIVVNRFLGTDIRYLGGVPQDVNVQKAVMEQKPFALLYPNTPASRALYELAGMICDCGVSEQKSAKGIAQLIYDLFKIKSGKRNGT